MRQIRAELGAVAKADGYDTNQQSLSSSLFKSLIQTQF